VAFKANMTRLDERYQKHPSMVSRQIAGEVILVPIRKNVGDLESIYTLNETGAVIWALLDGKRTLAEIRDQMVVEFEVTPEEAAQDLDELIGQMAEIGAVEKL
jgi:Coenzyme PQQ synthesis protein D (PqqD)